MTDGVSGPSTRVVRPAVALAVGLIIVEMMVGAAVIASAAHQAHLLNTVDQALEPAHVTVWTAPAATASRPG